MGPIHSLVIAIYSLYVINAQWMGVASVMQLIVDWHDDFFYACGLCVMWVFEHAIADLFKREIDRKTFIICLPLFIYRLT